MVKKFLNGIPDTHPAHRYINASDDLLTDAGVIDTFLHTQDVAFNTVELKDLIEESGLVFQSWFDNVYHYYTQYTLKNIKENQEYYDKIYKRIEGLDFWKQAEIAHNTNFSLGMFNFILRKDKNCIKLYFMRLQKESLEIFNCNSTLRKHFSKMFLDDH